MAVRRPRSGRAAPAIPARNRLIFLCFALRDPVVLATHQPTTPACADFPRGVTDNGTKNVNAGIEFTPDVSATMVIAPSV